MPIEEQAGWLEGVDDLVAVGDRVQDETLRRKYQRKYEKFLTMPFAEESIDALRQYVQTGLPIPLQSEVAFWSCSCLPSYSGAGTVLYSRVNVNWQEVLTICTYQGILCFSFHLAIAPLQAVYGLTLGSLADKYPTSSISGHFYEPGGHDQFQIQVEGYEEFRRFLSDPDVKKAIRTFNLRLIKKGPCAFSRYHCMGLADKLLAC